MYYLWKDKIGCYYITDYKEIRSDGFVQVDGYGFIQCDLVFSHKIKNEVIKFAQQQAFN